MPALPFFSAVQCPSCGGVHDFYIPDTDPAYSAGSLYRFVCPQTGSPVTWRRQEAHTTVSHPPQGAVPMTKSVP